MISICATRNVCDRNNVVEERCRPEDEEVVLESMGYAFIYEGTCARR